MDNTLRPQKFNRRIGVAVILGNTAAWADFALYAYFGTVLSKRFFPFSNYSEAYISYFIIFAIAFLFRPIGASIAGGFADRRGRKNTLLATVIFSSLTTTIIGCLPSYAEVGIWSPILLAIFRILQTMSVAAEPTNSSALLLEYSADNRRGFITSCVMTGVFLGFLLGIVLYLLVSAFMTDAQVAEWGWRIPFLISLPVGAVVAQFLYHTEESPVFLERKKNNHIAAHPLRLVSQKYKMTVLVAFGYSIMMAVGNYFLVGFLPSYFVHNIHLSLVATNVYISIALVVSIILIPLMGYWSDVHGRKPIIALGAIAFIVFSYPMLYLINTGHEGLIITAMIIYGIALAPTAAVMATAIAEMFPFEARCTGTAIGYNVALVLFGGTTPIISEALLKYTNNSHLIFWYISLTAIIHLIFIIVSKETYKNSID